MSETSVRFRQAEVAMAHDRLTRYGEMAQIEAIARHYLRHAQLARDMVEIINYGRGSTLDDNSTACLRMLAETIRTNHAIDLGLELAWPDLLNSCPKCGAPFIGGGECLDCGYRP